MANETRPRRESSGTSRIRKTSPSPSATVPDGQWPRPARPDVSRSGRAGRPAGENARDRQDREPFREEAPADREPIRFIRERDRDGIVSQAREPVRERPSASPF